MMRSRPTTYRGTPMRSRLEAAWAEQFDALGWAWQYEPECFGTTEGQYLPDFAVVGDDGLLRYVEVKPTISTSQMLDIVNVQMARWGRIIAANDPDAVEFVLAFGADEWRQLQTFHMALAPPWRPRPSSVLADSAGLVPSLHGVVIR